MRNIATLNDFLIFLTFFILYLSYKYMVSFLTRLMNLSESSIWLWCVFFTNYSKSLNLVLSNQTDNFIIYAMQKTNLKIISWWNSG